VHGQREVSMWPRLTWVVAHLALFGLGVWLTVGGGVEAFGWMPGDRGRQAVLALFGGVLWLRITFMALRLLRRRFGWEEAIASTAAVAIYQVVFAFAGATHHEPMGWLEAIGIGLFVVGSGMNTGAELQRRRFKQDPRHAGQLYTGGLFAVVRHPNYLGDVLWVTGWGLVTGEPLALLVPLGLVTAFVAYFIPTISEYLRRRYGDAYLMWSAHTPRLFPWLY
jgi:protein-S-isoprenylcysteine O-methyltransferase Ste14